MNDDEERDGGVRTGASLVYDSALTTLGCASLEVLEIMQRPSRKKLVEAPGVEGRGEGSGFEGLRAGSSGVAGDSAGLAAGDGKADALSSGLADLRCVSEGAGHPQNLGPNPGHESPFGSVGAGGDAADGDIRLLKGRLVALEHVLGAVGALLEAGAVQEALSLVRGWRWRG